MSSQTTVSAVNLNALAKMVSNAGLQRIMFDDDYRRYGKQMKALLAKSGVQIDGKCSFREMIEHSYSQLLKHYRHEYLYKTALLNSYVLKYYSLADTILLNEFKVGNSIADTVLVNGTNKVFEIKTELDSPDRLSSQITDYYKAFSEVYIVVHHSHVQKYMQLVSHQVGIMSFDLNTIKMNREAICNKSKLDVATMMKALRKDEYLQVVKKLSGKTPDVQPVLLFKECLNILSKYTVGDVQFEFLKVIKNRINPVINKFIAEPDLPASLRLPCYNSSMTQNDYISLIKRLSYQL